MLHHSLATTSIAPHLLADAPHIHRQGQLDVRIARSEAEIAAAQALRYRIFYEEMGAKPTLAMQAVLDPLPVSRIWGVGQKTAARLEDLRIRTIGQLRRTPRERLARDLGAHMADHLLALASGIDTRPVAPREPAKSIGKEVTFPTDIESAEAVERVLLALSEKVGYRLRRTGCKGRTVQLKLRLGDFRTYTRSRTLAEASPFLSRRLMLRLYSRCLPVARS